MLYLLFVCNNWFTFHDEISKPKDIFHMDGYPKDIFYFHIKKFLSEKLMTTNRYQDMNDEKKYAAIMPFICHPSIIFKKSLTKTLKSINKNVVQYLKLLMLKTIFF